MLDGACGEKHDSADDADHDGIAGPFRHGDDCAVAEGDGRFSLGFTAFTLLFRYGAAANPKQRYQRDGSEGESGGSEEQRCCGVHALHLRHECESPNEAASTRHAMPPISFLCMSTHRKACLDQRINLATFWSGFIRYVDRGAIPRTLRHLDFSRDCQGVGEYT